MKYLLSALALLAVTFAIVTPPVQAQQRVVTFTVTTVNQRIPTITLTTTSSACSIIIYSGSGSITAQASSDNAVSWSTATPFGSNGVVSGVGTYTATIATTGLTSFGGYLSTAGTGVVGAEVCSSSVATNLVPNPVITGTITAGGYYTANGGFNSGPDCTSTTSQGVLCLEFDHSTGQVRLGGSTYQGFFAYSADSSTPQFSLSCLHAGCTQNIFSSLGNYWGNANAPVPSPAPSGYQGPAVIAQATAAPTMQPGTSNVAHYFAGPLGVTEQYPNAYAFISNQTNDLTLVGNTGGSASGVSGTFFAITAANYSFTPLTTLVTVDASGDMGLTGAIKAGAHNACSASSGNPCNFSWTCTRSAGTCTTTQAVPATSNCWLEATQTPIVSTSNLVSVWPSPLSDTSLTINVQDELGTSTGSYGGIGGCT